MLIWRTCSILSFVTLACVAGASAQDAASPFPGPESLALSLALRTRIERAGQVRAEGAWGAAVLSAPRITGTGLEYSDAQPPRFGGWTVASLPNPIPARQISNLQIRVGSSRRGAIIGGIAGGILAAALGAAGASAEGVGDPGGLLGFVFLGALNGAGGGALIGMVVPRWQTVYTR